MYKKTADKNLVILSRQLYSNRELASRPIKKYQREGQQRVYNWNNLVRVKERTSHFQDFHRGQEWADHHLGHKNELVFFITLQI
jgi:hypothetical protein